MRPCQGREVGRGRKHRWETVQDWNKFERRRRKGREAGDRRWRGEGIYIPRGRLVVLKCGSFSYKSMEEWKGGPWRSRGERKRVRIPKIYLEDQTVAAAQFRIKSVIDRLVDIIKIGVMGSM
jgi:hypothetical protein